MARLLKSRIKTNDSNFIEILKHATGAIILLGIGSVMQFIFDLLLTRTFNASGAGIFYLSFSVIMTLALIGRLGFDRAVVRFIPPLLASKPGSAAGVKRTAVRLSLALTLPIAVILYVLAPVIADKIFDSPELTSYLQIFSFALPFLSLNYIYSGVLRSLKRTWQALSIERLAMYTLGIIAVLTLGMLYGLKGVAIGFVAAIGVTTINGIWYIRKYMPKYGKVVPFSKKRLFIVSGPLLFVTFASQMSGQASLLLLGVFSSNADVGIFTVALKISLLMGLILTAINVIAGTTISELYSAKRKKELDVIISKISALGAAWGMPAFVILAVFSHFWLGLFGSEFTAGTSALIILAAGQLINVSVGSTGYIMAMTGHERAMAGSVATSLLVNIGLGIILIPIYGVVGAAMATAITITIKNAILSLMVRHYLQVWPLPFKYLKVWSKNIRTSNPGASQ